MNRKESQKKRIKEKIEQGYGLSTVTDNPSRVRIGDSTYKKSLVVEVIRESRPKPRINPCDETKM